MRRANFKSYSLASIVLLSLALAAAVFSAPSPAAAPQAPPAHQIARFELRRESNQRTGSLARRRGATATSATPTIAAPARIRVGIQAGHWLGGELPDELAHLQLSAGTSAGGATEAEVNRAIALRVATLLESIGVTVDLLPAAVPPGYTADAFVALHADGFRQMSAHGFKVATAWATSRASEQLRTALADEYARATELPQHGAITVDMRGYYAFNYRRYVHAIAPTTPAAIVEMGFLTNPDDRALLVARPDLVAVGIANGIVQYLNQRDPSDLAALQPPDFGVWHGGRVSGLDIRAAPRQDAPTLLHIEADRAVIPFEQQGEWFRVIVAGAWDVIGWVRQDELVRIVGT
jgi:N-acetylmuramoyl-L-alanine amidase